MNTNINTIRILAFGDSNTWGRIPGDDNTARYQPNVRWTGVLQNLLGDKYDVVEEGLNGRTTNLDSPHKAGKNGSTYFFSCLESQKPLDVVIIALGKNDLKAKYNRSAVEIAQGLAECVEAFKKEGKTRNSTLPTLIILSTCIVQEIERERFGKMETDFLGANLKSKQLPALYKAIAENNNAIFTDLSEAVPVSTKDGVHLEIAEHEKIATILFQEITSLAQ
jgi:lysophospholipase L1-like esterase